MNKLLTILLFIPLTVFSQEPVKKITEIDKKNETKEVYHVLKSDKSIRHGDYRKYGRDKLIVEGNYNNGEKEIFKFFDDKGNITLEYDFVSFEVIKYEEKDYAKKVYDINGNEIVVDRPPLLLISNFEMRRFIDFNLRYPKLAKEQGISGKTEISLYIDKNGNLVDIKIYKAMNQILDNEALRVFNQLPKDLKWIPASKNDTLISSMIVVSLSFTIN